MATLYELTDAYNELLEAVMGAETGDEISGLIAQLDEIDEAWDVKAENYARVMKEAEARAAAAEAEAKRLTERRRRYEATVEGLKARMKMAMKLRGVGAVETPIGTWKIGKGRESVQIIDAAKVPEQFLVYADPTVSKAAVMDWYKETGEVVPGTDIVRNPTFGLK